MTMEKEIVMVRRLRYVKDVVKTKEEVDAAGGGSGI